MLALIRDLPEDRSAGERAFDDGVGASNTGEYVAVTPLRLLDSRFARDQERRAPRPRLRT